MSGHTAVNTGIATDPAVGSELNSSPVQIVRYGNGADGCDVRNNTFWSDAGTHSTPCAFNVTAFKTWCLSLHPRCVSIFTLPGEIDSVSTAAYFASYIVNTLGYQPDYWTIGNEPSNWDHWGVPWTSWATNTTVSTPTAMQYAQEVHLMIRAITAPGVDPAAKFVGIQAPDAGQSTWFTDLGLVDGSSLSWVAYHSYPSPGANPTLPQFYATLSSVHNISTTYSTVQGYFTGTLSNLSNLPIQIGEYNAGPGGPGGPAMCGTVVCDSLYQDAVFMSASVAQALEAKVQSLVFFTLQDPGTTYGFDMMNSADQRDPVAVLYDSVFPFLHGAVVHNVAVKTSPSSSLYWAAELTTTTADGPVFREYQSLLVVNTDTTNSLTLSLGTAFTTSASGKVVTWDTTTTTPVTTSVTSFSTSYTIPTQGILLLNGSSCLGCITLSLPSGAAPVALNASGLTGDIYVADSGTGAVSIITQTNSVSTLTLSSCTTPSALAWSPATGDEYVACAGSSNVAILGHTNTLLSYVALGATYAPSAVTFDPANSNILVVDPNVGKVSVIGTGNTLIRTLTVGSTPSSATYDPANSEVVVTNSGVNTVAVIYSNLTVSFQSSCNNPIAGAYSAALSYLFVICGTSVSLTAYSPSNGQVLTMSLSPWGSPTGIVYNPHNLQLYISESAAGIVLSTDSRSLSPINVSVTAAGPTSLAFDPNDQNVYVTDGTGGAMTEIGPYFTVLLTALTGSNPLAVAYNAANHLMYVADNGGNSVWAG
jgi:DNA-binding beta-propeller fold protein YncE